MARMTWPWPSCCVAKEWGKVWQLAAVCSPERPTPCRAIGCDGGTPMATPIPVVDGPVSDWIAPRPC
jgi:hypothetical protein